MTRPRAHALVLGLLAAALLLAMAMPPIAQDPGYHAFADRRTVLGLANFSNVISNAGFVLVGLLGLAAAGRLVERGLRGQYLTFCVACVLIGVGSAWYHRLPSTASLVWDRAPMTLAVMSMLSIVISDRIDGRLGRMALAPLAVIGLASVGYWYATELAGRGDLRPYGLVQYLPVLLVPVMLVVYDGQAIAARWLHAAVVTYALAKVCEHIDAGMLLALGVSGHTVKHLLSALALLFALASVLSRGYRANRQAHPPARSCRNRAQPSRPAAGNR